MKNPRKTRIIVGSLGAIFGGILWIVIVGVILKSIFIITVPLALGILCFFTVSILASKYPKKYLSILGITILLVSEINFIFINLLFKKIPSQICNILTGKECFTVLQINIFLAIAFASISASTPL